MRKTFALVAAVLLSAAPVRAGETVLVQQAWARALFTELRTSPIYRDTAQAVIDQLDQFGAEEAIHVDVATLYEAQLYLAGLRIERAKMPGRRVLERAIRAIRLACRYPTTLRTVHGRELSMPDLAWALDMFVEDLNEYWWDYPYAWRDQ